MSITILLADDHALFRRGLRCILENEPGLEVVAEATDGRETVALAIQATPAVIVLDIAMPQLNGVEAARRITAASTASRILALSVHGSARTIHQMFAAGATGYLLKSAAYEELVTAVHALADNRSYISPSIAHLVVDGYLRHAHGNGNGNGHGNGHSDGADGDGDHSQLTPREREVLQLVAEGHGTKQIACQLKVSTKTVETHRYQMMRKLELRGIAELTRYALREGIISLD